MLERVKRTIEEYGLIEPGDKIIVAISGGPDSVCLLHVLYQLKETYDLELYGAHLNHNFRGIDAQMDAQYVAQLCEDLNILCFIKSLDVPQYAKEKGLSPEEAGRILRYEFFDEVAERVGAFKIAVAHNENDQAETVLMRLLRGTGLQGLAAIHHKRGKIIRPLLNIRREEIENYCNNHHLSPRIDHTNLETIYKRNQIRLELIPYLEEHYNANIISSLAKTAETLKNDFDYIEEQARSIYNTLLKREKPHCLEIPLGGINKLHSSLQSRVIRLAAEELVGRQEILEYKHIQNILELAKKGKTGKRILLPMGIIAKISYENLYFTTLDKEEEDFLCPLPEEGSLEVKEVQGKFTVKILDHEDGIEIARDKYRKCFDYDKVSNILNVRNRREGDRFHPLGLKGSKKLKDFFIDYKIDREERNKMPLVCDGDEIMWVVGLRISEKYKITSETKRILEIIFEKQEDRQE